MADQDVRQGPVHDVVDYDLLFDCVHCGLCLESCPTYKVDRTEMDSPRGRVYLMKGLAEGRINLDDDAVRHLDLCLGCRACETACPSGVHYERLVERARGYVDSNYRRTRRQRRLRRMASAIFPYPRRLRALLAPLKVAERLRMRWLFTLMLSGRPREWIDLLPPLVKKKRTRKTVPAAEIQPDAPAVVVHHGCVTQVVANSENLNSERILAASGYRVVRLRKTVCCGALDMHSGNLERARKFARANVKHLTQSGADAIVSAAAGCAASMAEYGELLKDDAKLAEDARAVSAKVRDVSSLVLERSIPDFREMRCIVTYHDACHLAHGLGVRDEPRKLLRAIPGVRLIEMTESDTCCGSAGTYNLTEPGMARQLVRRKVDRILTTKADYVVLANPGCQFQIAAELRRRGSRTRVIHLADFLAMAAAR